MGTHKNDGFTIIETVLFLGVSTALIMAMIVGAGASLNVQRYRDAAETFKLVLQQQYADLISVQNGRTNNWYCGADGQPVEGASASQDRGQSNCILAGKYLYVEDDEITAYTVVATGDEPELATNDIETLKNNYKLNASEVDAEVSKLEWGTKIAWPKTIKGVANVAYGTPRKIGILVVRSPSSGQIYTFTNSPSDSSINSLKLAQMLETGNKVPGQGEQVICIDSDGLFATSDRAVVLNSFASTGSAVELRTNDFMKPAVEC